MPDESLPTGTVTFLFTDVEGSTRLWEAQHDAMATALSLHDRLLRSVIAAHGGHVFKTVGDAFCSAFQTPIAALMASLAAQRALAVASWGEVGQLSVRMALHTGAAEERDADYFGPTVNRVARLLSAGHGGQVLLSAAARDAIGAELPAETALRDLGERRLKDLARPERVFQFVAPDLPETFPPLATLDARPNNLPAQPTPLLGRDAELAAAKERLRAPGTRLLTLTGPGGTGKTRLSLQIAADLIDDFAHGAWFVDLGAVLDAALVAAEIARALEVREEGSGSLELQLLAHLRERQLLLVLDNFEQVLPAATLVGRIIAACPKVRLLATSRARLRVNGEREHPVPPLGLPDLKSLPDPERLTAFPAVELFVQRAAATKPEFALTAANAPAVAEICVALDGLPLAIELAAARINLLPPQAMLPRLGRRLTLLTGGARDRAERQQTLRGTIAWSYDLLSAHEQALFARLSVFAGGWTFEAAAAVTNADGAIDPFEATGQLVEHSLVRQEERDGEPRFGMLATLREFAAERLAERGEIEPMRRAHAAYVRAVAEEARPHLVGADQAAWLDRLEAEHDNVRAALAWSLDGGDREDALRLAGSLWRFWYVRGHLSEGRSWIERAIAHRDGRPPDLVGDVLDGAGMLAEAQGAADAATAFLEEALLIRKTSGSDEGIAGTLVILGNLQQYQGDYESAERHFREAAELARDAGAERQLANAVSSLGDIAMWRGDHDAARQLLEDGLDLFRRLGDRRGECANLLSLGGLHSRRGEFLEGAARSEEGLVLSRTLGDQGATVAASNNLAGALFRLDDLERVEELCTESRQLSQQIGYANGHTVASNFLGRLSTKRGALDQASDYLRESLEVAQQAGDKALVADAVEALGQLAFAEGDPFRATQLLSTADALFDAIGAALPGDLRADFDACLAMTKRDLGPDRFSAAWQCGRRLGVDDLLGQPAASTQTP